MSGSWSPERSSSFARSDATVGYAVVRRSSVPSPAMTKERLFSRWTQVPGHFGGIVDCPFPQIVERISFMAVSTVWIVSQNKGGLLAEGTGRWVAAIGDDHQESVPVNRLPGPLTTDAWGRIRRGSVLS